MHRELIFVACIALGIFCGVIIWCTAWPAAPRRPWPVAATPLRPAVAVANGGECVICIEDMEVGSQIVRLACGHGYHAGCIIEWRARSSQCPVCRTTMEV